MSYDDPFELDGIEYEYRFAGEDPGEGEMIRLWRNGVRISNNATGFASVKNDSRLIDTCSPDEQSFCTCTPWTFTSHFLGKISETDLVDVPYGAPA